MTEWHTLETQDAVHQIQSDLENGLTAVEAARRLEEFGPNELVERVGISPWTILLEQFKGDASTGITIMRMEAGLDTGPMLSSQAVDIAPDETGGSLHDRLAQRGATMIVDALDRLEAGTAQFRPQDDAAATYARKLAKAEAVIDWTQPAEVLERQVRAFDPWPVAETRLDGQQLRIWRAHAEAAGAAAPPGTVLFSGKDGIVVMSGGGALVLDRVQLPGKRAVTAPEFARAQDLTGRVLG